MIGISAHSQIKDDTARYKKLCANATKAAMRDAAKLVAKRARASAPVASKHRVVRGYPGGSKTWSDTRRIKASVKYSVKKYRSAAAFYARIFVGKLGYSVFQEFGWQPKTPGGRTVGGKVAGRSFMRKALADTHKAVITLLQARWPK